jgi:hypothetical protein
MPRFQFAKLRSVPLALAPTEVDPFADHGVTQLVVQYRRNPFAGAWFEELSRDYHSPLPDVA